MLKTAAMVKTMENAMAEVEQFINPIDWVPFVASFSGMVRILAGSVQVVAGAAFAALEIFYIILTGRGYDEKKFIYDSSYEQAIERGITYSFHGIGNVTRGCVAMLPVVNMILALYDYKIGRMNYENEILKKDVYPIMTAHRFASNPMGGL